jgi:hypothetical protein
VQEGQVVLYHVDGEHTVKGAYHDISLCFENGHAGCYILVDDYNQHPSIRVTRGTDKWVEEHKGLVETQVFPDTANGDFLIKILGE